jgi:hypothetical protein
MAIPDYQSIMLPLLKFMSDGEEHIFSAMVEALAATFNPTEEERKVRSKGVSAHCYAMYKVGNHRLQLLTQIIQLVTTNTILNSRSPSSTKSTAFLLDTTASPTRSWTSSSTTTSNIGWGRN